jgi:uncharacterized membrane protein
MEQKIRGLLAYIFGWIGGLIVLFAFKDNDSRTKFNACQAITLGAAADIVAIVLGFIPIIGLVASLFSVFLFVLRVIGAVKAYQEEDYELPVVSDLTREIFKGQLD